MPKNFRLKGLKDSKKLSAKKRYEFSDIIKQQAIAWAVGYATSTEIDKRNILDCSILAMHRALRKLTVEPEFILVDGNKFYAYKHIPNRCIIKGDTKFSSIAAAAVLAKTFRDNYLTFLHKKFPFYSWNTNNGYPTLGHKRAILKHGISPYHRKTFKLLSSKG